MAQEYKHIQQQITGQQQNCATSTYSLVSQRLTRLTLTAMAVAEAGLSGDGEAIQRLSKKAGHLEPVASGYDQLLRLVREVRK